MSSRIKVYKEQKCYQQHETKDKSTVWNKRCYHLLRCDDQRYYQLETKDIINNIKQKV
jgi:hypothetical protein